MNLIKAAAFSFLSRHLKVAKRIYNLGSKPLLTNKLATLNIFFDVQSRLQFVNVTTNVCLRSPVVPQPGFELKRTIPLTFQASDKVLMRELVLNGTWEPQSILAASLELKEQSKHGRRFQLVDIGANVGIFSIQLHTALKAMAISHTVEKTIAFEPEKENYTCLLENFRRAEIGNYETIQAGVGATTGEMVLHKDSNNPGNSSYLRASVRDPNQSSSVTKVDTFDNLTAHLDPSELPIFLKVDVQGFEPEVVQGISDASWHKVNILIIEITPTLLKSSRADYLEAMLIRLRDFKLSEITSSGTLPINLGALTERILAGNREFFDVIGVRTHN